MIYIIHSLFPFFYFFFYFFTFYLFTYLPFYFFLAESTIEARIIGLQDLKQAVVNEIINENNSGSIFLRSASLTTSETSSSAHNKSIDNSTDIKPDKSYEKMKSQERRGFGTVLWNSVRTSVLENKGTVSTLERMHSSEDVTEVRVAFILSR